jgi:hypothetical protein
VRGPLYSARLSWRKEKNGERTEFVMLNRVNRAGLYFFLIYLNCNSHRFFIVPNLVERLPRNFFWKFAPTPVKGSHHA